MIRYNWKTQRYEVWIDRLDGRPSIVVADFCSEQTASQYLRVHHIKV